MYFDVNVRPELNLNENDFDGFCVTQQYSNDLIWPSFQTNKRIYKKVEVNYQEIQCLKNIKKYDVLCVRVPNCDGLEKIIEQEPDLITFDFDVPQKFKVRHLRMAIKRNIYFEVPLCYKNKMIWLSNIAELLRILRYRNIVFGSCAKVQADLKKPSDIVELLIFLGFNKNKIQKILGNSIKLLETCAMRRYCYKNCIMNDVGIMENPENTNNSYSSLKNDFLGRFFI